jgi:hypothetical protein
MLVMGEESPLDGEGLFVQFLPKRVVGLISVLLSLVFFASLVSAAADHLRVETLRLVEKQHELEDTLGAVFAIPGMLFFTGLFGALTFNAVQDRDGVAGLLGAVFLCFLTLVSLAGFFFALAYFHVTQDPVTFLRNL